MSHIDSGPLATYSSLQDKHLVGYFNNTRMKRHLRRAGLVTRRGEIVTESTYRLNMARKEHQRHVRDLMAQAIVHKTLDLERQRQSEIKQKLEEIAKVELVRRVRMDRARKGDEDITHYLSPRGRGRPKSAYTDQARQPQPPGGARPSTAPARQRPSSKRAGVVYVDQDGYPVHRESPRSDTSYDDGEVDSPALRELDPKILHRISLNLKPDEKEGLSPYSPDVTPRPPPVKSKGQRSPRSRTGGVVTKSGRGYRPRSNRGSLALHRKEPAYPHPTQLQTMCDVTVRYRGTGLKIQYEREDKRDEIQIYQQHCGGENLVVFSGLAEKGNDLIFVSRRHRGYPFSVTFFVNRVQVLRLSACCEYKYTPGALLGGSKGHFKFISVHGSSPCYRCLVEAEFARRERQRYKDSQTEPVVPPPEPVPEYAGMSTQTEAPPEEVETKEETTQKNDEEEDKEGEKIERKVAGEGSTNSVRGRMDCQGNGSNVGHSRGREGNARKSLQRSCNVSSNSDHDESYESSFESASSSEEEKETHGKVHSTRNTNHVKHDQSHSDTSTQDIVRSKQKTELEKQASLESGGKSSSKRKSRKKREGERNNATSSEGNVHPSSVSSKARKYNGIIGQNSRTGKHKIRPPAKDKVPESRRKNARKRKVRQKTSRSDSFDDGESGNESDIENESGTNSPFKKELVREKKKGKSRQNSYKDKDRKKTEKLGTVTESKRNNNNGELGWKAKSEEQRDVGSGRVKGNKLDVLSDVDSSDSTERERQMELQSDLEEKVKQEMAGSKVKGQAMVQGKEGMYRVNSEEIFAGEISLQDLKIKDERVSGKATFYLPS